MEAIEKAENTAATALIDLETPPILCHRCRWGATPGNLTVCRCPDLPNDLNDLRNTDNPEAVSRAEVFAVSGCNPVAWALPSIAVASGQCRHYTARK